MKKKYYKNIETGHIYNESGDKFGYQYLKATPMDVYRGKTTLEYTVRDGEVINSVVVFKENYGKQ